ncbi:hypothetical protein GINT2_001539 [Glugoides intestinalis]
MSIINNQQQNETADLSNLNQQPGVPNQLPQQEVQYTPQQGMQYPPQQGMQYPPQQGIQQLPQQGMQYPPQQGMQYTPQQGMQYPPQQGIQQLPQQEVQYASPLIPDNTVSRNPFRLLFSLPSWKRSLFQSLTLAMLFDQMAFKKKYPGYSLDFGSILLLTAIMFIIHIFVFNKTLTRKFSILAYIALILMILLIIMGWPYYHLE